MSQLLFSMCWDPKETGADARERTDLPVRASFLLPCPLYRLPEEGVAQIKGILVPSPKIWIKSDSFHFE